MHYLPRYLIAFLTTISFLLSPPAMATEGYTTNKIPDRGVFQDIPVLSQGDQVFIDKRKTCTVGYIDKEHGLAYLAEHCAVPGKKAQVHNSEGYFVGTITSRYHDSHPGMFHQQKMSEDFNVVDIDTTHVFLGDNAYSGDQKVVISQVAQGDKVCMYSRMQKRVKCGSIAMVTGDIIVLDSHAQGEKGDSGGPVWIPGKGFIGVYTSSLGGMFYGFSTSFEQVEESKGMVDTIASYGLKSFSFSSQSSSTGKDKWYKNEKLIKKSVISSSVLFASFTVLGF